MGKTIDIDDADKVLEAMASELDIDADDLTIEESHYGSFGAGGSIWEIKIDGGRKEWHATDYDTAEQLAVEIVKQDLDQEPEIFNKDFIERWIDEDKLRDELHDDVYGGNVDYLSEASPEDFWRTAEGYGLEVPEEDEDGELREPTSKEIDEAAEAMTDEQLKDPMGYLEDIYGKAEAVEQAIKIAGIDIDAAAKDAVDTDGPGHFLGSYDGDLHEGPGGLVYWRTN